MHSATARHLTLVRRNKKRMKNRDAWVGCRVRAQTALERAGHWGIRVRMSRATIGQIYNHARMREALLTFRYLDPIIVPADELENLTKARASKITSEILYQELKTMARKYARKRDPVRHPVWKEPK